MFSSSFPIVDLQFHSPSSVSFSEYPSHPSRMNSIRYLCRLPSLFFLLVLTSSNLITFYFASSNCFKTTAPSPSPSSSSSSSSAPLTSLSSSPSPSTPFPSEFIAFTSPQNFPLGRNPNSGSEILLAPVGTPCHLFPDELFRYMTYPVNGSCPDDELLAQRLLLKGCEPLPRRRCHPAAPPSFPEPFPLPLSLWTIPHDDSIVWTAYSCKNFTCLVNRKNQKAFDDCKDCFDLQGREKTRWVIPSDDPVNFSIDHVLELKPLGSIRIGLDIGGGTGTFAVRMKEKGVTIVTTSMNLNGPFNSFIAARGVVPLFITISQRLPFFDNTLDIVHSMHVLSNWIPDTLFHFILFDIYRILRPGGIFWLDRFFFLEAQMEKYVDMINSVGFSTLKWGVSRKTDRGPALKEMYIAAVLEKPLQNSW